MRMNKPVSNNYDHKTIEKKWGDKWTKEKLYQPDIKASKKPFYNLMMFPYPSAEGLHVGNMYAFTGADVYGRYNRMLGFDIFEPIGLDGFGIHSENYAIQVGKHPVDHAKESQENFYRQLGMIGNGYAWDNHLETYDPNYYKWTQWLFVQMFKAGLAYKDSAMVNWCPSCKTVLADEQVIDTKCERCKSDVIRKRMSSWFFRITKYAERLLKNIDGDNKPGEQTELAPVEKGYDPSKMGLRWPEKIKSAQRNWIGKKTGINITYPIDGTKETLTCFTTRPDTNYGATFVVVAPEYVENFKDLIPQEKKLEIEEYIKVSLNKTEQQRKEEGKEKSGVFTGLYALNQLNNYKMPIWISDFVLMDVGTGAVVGVPGHDTRDFEFATKYKLPVIRVVVGSDGDTTDIVKVEQVQEDEGKMVNSEFLNGMDVNEALNAIMDHLEEKGWGKKEVNYHLRDWLISRQRYWGPPIPMIFCEVCKENGKGEQDSMPGWYSVHELDLPVELPNIKDYKPKGDGSSPLVNAPDDWKSTTCPGCEGKAQRELDVSDTFLDSSWYFLAYPNLATSEWEGNSDPFNKEITGKWLPVDAYIGGAEHAVLHLLYSRFVTMVLKDAEYLDFEEPFPFLYGHGLLIKDGAKMSKSRGNIVVPDEYIVKYGSDTLRTYLMFLGPYDQGGDFRDTGIEGMRRFMNRVWQIYSDYLQIDPNEEDLKNCNIKMHQTIKKVTNDLKNFRYNTAIASIMEYVNTLRAVAKEGKRGQNALWKVNLGTLSLLMAPFAPHMAEEIWTEVLGNKFSVHKQQWPLFDESLTKNKKVTIAIQVNGKLRGTLVVGADKSEDEETIVALSKTDEKVKKWLTGNPKKVIFVPGKIVNFII